MVKTDFLKLQRIMVNSEQKTVQKMLEFVKYESTNLNITVLNNLGECIANSILHLSDMLSLITIVRNIKERNISPEKLKTYLLALLKVMRGINFWSKERRKTDKKFLNELDEVSQDTISSIMSSQFTTDEE
jgi:hypothetical protein